MVTNMCLRWMWPKRFPGAWRSRVYVGVFRRSACQYFTKRRVVFSTTLTELLGRTEHYKAVNLVNMVTRQARADFVPWSVRTSSVLAKTDIFDIIYLFMVHKLVTTNHLNRATFLNGALYTPYIFRYGFFIFRAKWLSDSIIRSNRVFCSTSEFIVEYA